MSSDRTRSTSRSINPQQESPFASTYYGLLNLHPSASAIEIRRTYRILSKRYHPDTTLLPQAIATVKFQELNEAYGILSNPERRLAYDQKIRYSRYLVVQPSMNLDCSVSARCQQSSSAYLDATDRPLSPGEIFALLMMGVSLVGCLILAIVVGLIRSDLHLELIQPPL
ncbi:MAG: J domain-containing protein [Oscillatoriales cyanobacterium RM2_1_1]|nr:J domain-containing protein [Oscillatoriales cyanobacterium SM2_3_0]NJO45777.1 J domain-containing protein [Oscillatoriales cyanobacterium RM2_1_1]